MAKAVAAQVEDPVDDEGLKEDAVREEITGLLLVRLG